jgi:hypothetical protein
MEIAATAWSKLTPAARMQASRLLKLNPMYTSWTNGVPAQQRDQVAFMLAATWPDAIKHLDDYHADGPANGERPPPGPQAWQNIGYADKSMHKYWHFINELFSPDGTPLHGPEAPNAQTQIAAFRAKPADPTTPDDVKSYGLVWLLHAPIGIGSGPFALTDGYKSKALEIAKGRVALAGARLANLLNAALK